MLVNDKRDFNTKAFEDIDPSNLFYWNDAYFLKIRFSEDLGINAINVENGEGDWFDSYDEVQYISPNRVSLVIED